MKRYAVLIILLLSMAALIAGPSYDYRHVLVNDSLPSGGMCNVSIYYPLFKGQSSLANIVNAFVDQRVNAVGVMEETNNRQHYTEYWDLAAAIIDEWQRNYNIGPGFEVILDISVLLNRDIVTLYVSDYIYAGGAHGNGVTTWHMFDPDGQEIAPDQILKPDAHKTLNELLMKHFNEQYENRWEHGEDYITSPLTFTLADEGLLVMYEGCCKAEGYPVICIPRVEALTLVRKEILDLY